MTIDDLAAICHDANRRYCIAQGMPASPLWEEALESQRESVRTGVKLRLANLFMPDSFNHEHWLKYKIEQGWTYGPAKDETKKQHDCLVPFNQLPPKQQAKDALFSAIVRTCAPFVTD